MWGGETGAGWWRGWGIKEEERKGKGGVWQVKSLAAEDRGEDEEWGSGRLWDATLLCARPTVEEMEKLIID